MTDDSHDRRKRRSARSAGKDGGARGVAAALWTQDQAVAYESARDCIAHLISHYSDLIEEGRRRGLDQIWLDEYERQIARLAAERQHLHVGDDASVGRIRKEYGRLVPKCDGRGQNMSTG